MLLEQTAAGLVYSQLINTQRVPSASKLGFRDVVTKLLRALARNLDFHLDGALANHSGKPWHRARIPGLGQCQRRPFHMALSSGPLGGLAGDLKPYTHACSLRDVESNVALLQSWERDPSFGTRRSHHPKMLHEVEG